MPFAWLLRIAGIGVFLCCAVGSSGDRALTVVPGRIPYLGETVGHVVVTVAPNHPGESLTLEVATATGTVLGAGPVAPGKRSAVEIPLGGLLEGTTVLHCRLLAEGVEVATATVRLTKLLPRPHAVQIDNRRRGLMVDGLPFFPFGFISIPPGRPEGDARIPPDLAAQGFNLYTPYSSGEGAAGLGHIRAWMDRCAEVGVKVNFDLRYDCFAASREAEITPEKKRLLRTYIEALRDHPALLSWYIADEPYDKHFERLAAMRRFVKELDPYHPVSIIFLDWVPQRPDWREITDVTWIDCYPVNLLSRDQKESRYWLSVPPEARRGVATHVAHWLRRIDGLFAYSSPLWWMPQCFGGGGTIWPSNLREPSAQELRAMTYAGLISGATAVQYFAYTPGLFPTSPRLWAEAGRLAQETIELTPFLLSEEPRRRVTAGSPAVLTAGWQDRGIALVVAVNVENAPTSLQVTLEDSGYSGPAEVLFENRQVEVRAGVILDTIEAQGTRVYQIPEGPFPADRATLSPANLRLNPSFEEWFNAGSPPDNVVRRGVGCTCFLDARTAVHGRHSLRMTASGTEGIWMDSIKVDLRAAKRYRVSIWAKANRPGLSLRLALPHTDRAGGEQFTLSTEWKEYSLFATPQGDVECVSRLQFDGPGMAWVDLFQIVPTE